jgi:hypothetical protein
MAESVPVSDEVHKHQCRLAGCKHPAVYELDDGTTTQGWCDLCRGLAFDVTDAPDQ